MFHFDPGGKGCVEIVMTYYMFTCMILPLFVSLLGAAIGVAVGAAVGAALRLDAANRQRRQHEAAIDADIGADFRPRG
jgi:hypothetical protein